jgi:hypothetical protein
MLDDVQIDTSSYVVVKVDMMHENSKDLKLEVPPDDTTLTMQDAITRSVQWSGLLLMLTHQQQLQCQPLLVSRIPLLLQ